MKREVIVQRIAANSYDVRGQLAGVDPSTVKVSEGYYTDSRVQATLTTYGDDGYQPHERLRIVLYSDGKPEKLMTGFVTERKPYEKSGGVQHDYALDSSLYALSTDKLARKWAIQGSGMDALKSMLDLCGRPYVIKAGALDKRFTSATVFDVGTTYLSMAFQLLEGQSRLDVDADGNVTVEKYVAPSQQTPTRRIDPDASDGDVVGDVSTTDGSAEVPGRVIAKSGSEESEMWAVADVSASAESSSTKRGYMVSNVVNSNDQDVDWAGLSALAKSSLDQSQDPGIEHQLTVLYGSWHEGDVATLRVYGRDRKCLVKSVSTDFSSMTQQLTLKEV